MLIDYLKKYIKILIPACLLSVALMITGAVVSYPYYNAVHQQALVTASVSKVEEYDHPESMEDWKIYVSYEYDGVTYTDVFCFDSTQQLPIGHEVEVYVNPSDPAKIVREDGMAIVVIGVAVLLLTVLVTAVFYGLRHRFKTISETDSNRTV